MTRVLTFAISVTQMPTLKLNSLMSSTYCRNGQRRIMERSIRQAASADCWTMQEELDWLEPQMENIYDHKRPAIQEYNVATNKDMLTIGRRRRQLPFKIDGNSINPRP
jgi:hypothetical protein